MAASLNVGLLWLLFVFTPTMNAIAHISLAFCYIALTTADVDQERHNTIKHEAQVHSDDSETEGTAVKSYGYGHSIGSGLVSIAQGAAEQAKSAIQNQHDAGGQAAFQAKSSIAQNAAAAAATARAALTGKQVIVSTLEQQYRDAHGQVEAEALQLTQAQRAAVATRDSAQQAQVQVRALTAALNAAQQNAEQATRAAKEAAGELASQSSMLTSAKQRLNLIGEQLGDARADLEATQNAAAHAAAAAATAQANAAKHAAQVHHAPEGHHAADFGDEAGDFVTKFGFHHSYY